MPDRSYQWLFCTALVLIPLQSVKAQRAAMLTGPHANEAFCKTMMTQYDVSMAYMRSTIGKVPDLKSRQKFFSDQRAINVILLRQAPASLKSDITMINNDANTSFDAQLRAGPRQMLAAMAPLRSPAHLAAAKRANAYCGVVATK